VSAFRWEDGLLAADLPGGAVRFTSRQGGVSEGPYASLNLGRGTDDDPERVQRNRVLLAERLGRGLVGARQVHGTVVRRPGDEAAEADGQVVMNGDAALVLTADCLAIALVADGAVAMLHGGWRGLAGGIVAEGVRALRESGARGPVVAALGPAARGCCYEVGEEVHAHFAAHDARVGERNLALDVVATDQLRAAGVDEVHDTGLCTMCDDRFFSHRRDRGVTGRQGGLAWRT
jgi:hypothetical protein